MQTTSLSETGKRWILDDTLSCSPEALIVELLRKRHLTDDDQKISFAECFPQIGRAIDRIEEAIDAKETIAIFGDYDCDGITASVQLMRFFKRRNTQPILRLPHRERDGYGLNVDVVREFAAQNVTLLITVDTGITSTEEVLLASQLGIDTIITDHHTIPEKHPNAFAILHPDISSSYPKPHPSGAGVTYHLLYALERGEWEDMKTDLILAMLGTVADLVELKGANRRLVQEGLKALSQTTYKPLLELLEAANIMPSAVTSTDVAFRIAPRINASGRIDEPMKAVEALLHGGDAIVELDALNRKRQAQTQDNVDHALQKFDAQNPPALLHVADTEYGHGIVGLIAGRLTEQFGRPSMVAAIEGDLYTASLRSPECYHITNGLQTCADLLERFGGHAQAAGCTVHKENWAELCNRLTGDIEELTQPHDLQPTLHIDALLTLPTITNTFVENLSMLEPYGQGNREPLFILQNVFLEQARCVGNDSSHLQCSIGGRKAIGFGMGKFLPLCNEPLDVACRISLDTWKGAKSPQIMIVDIKKEATRGF